MRFTDEIHKVAVIIGIVTLGPLLGTLALILLFGLTGITTAVAEFSTVVWLVGTVVFCARTFRLSTDAPGSPRPWWMLTSTATAGYVLAAIFGSTGVWALFSLGFTWAAWFPGALLAPVGLAYLHSSLRLSRTPALTTA